jgi:methionyl-tRNA synthetase
MATVLYVTAEVIRQVALLIQPVVPEAAAQLLDLVAVPREARGFANLGKAGRLTPGTSPSTAAAGLSALCRRGRGDRRS